MPNILTPFSSGTTVAEMLCLKGHEINNTVRVVAQLHTLAKLRLCKIIPAQLDLR